jgi:hypothetical protein
VEMLPFVYTALPMRVIFGSGTLLHLNRELAALDRHRVLVLSTPAQEQQANAIADQLRRSSVGIFAGADRDKNNGMRCRNTSTVTREGMRCRSLLIASAIICFLAVIRLPRTEAAVSAFSQVDSSEQKGTVGRLHGQGLSRFAACAARHCEATVGHDEALKQLKAFGTIEREGSTACPAALCCQFRNSRFHQSQESGVAGPRDHRYRHSRSKSCESFAFPSAFNGLCFDPAEDCA